MNEKPMPQTEEEWKEILTPDEFRILREKGTERAFTGEYYDAHDDGIYRCRGCGEPLFDASTKYDSGSGWPSFYAALDKSKIAEIDDNSHGMHRVEVTCAKCGGHLGHLFPDGPAPTGVRYCINSMSLKLDKKA
jgi:peptide-methionine (R)-S-oxide reductase